MPKIEEVLLKIVEKLDNVSLSVHKIDKDLALHKSQFDQHIIQDEKMYEEFKRMNDILQQNTDSLKEHIHRTELLEDFARKMDSRLSPIEIKHIEDEAIKRHKYNTLARWTKILAAIATLGGLLIWAKPLLLKLLLS